MKDLITSSEAPSCRNSSYETYELTQKNCYRKHLNFLDIDPSFDFQISHVKLATANPPLFNHIHENSAEIVYVLRGKQTYFVNRTEYQIRGGEMLLSPPGIVHTGGNMPEQKGDFYYITINPDCIRDILPAADEITVRALIDMLLHDASAYCYSDTDQLKAFIEQLFMLHESRCSHKIMRIRCAICQLLLFTMDAIESEAHSETVSDFMNTVYLYIEDHVCEKLTVDQLAEHFQYSRTAFRDKFKGYFHLPVHEYILHCKIEKAKQFLQDPTIHPHEVWEMLSFSSFSYFNQVFKRFTGVTVAQYLRQESILPETDSLHKGQPTKGGNNNVL